MELAALRGAGFTYSGTYNPALIDATVTIESGHVYGVVGLNGSGKSTLCALLRGVIPHFHNGELTGEATIFGRSVTDWEPEDLAQRIGYVFQNPFTQISGVRDTVFEEIAYGLENLGVPREEIIARVWEVIQMLDLQDIMRKNPSELSGGQCQKVAFASIIVMDADFIVIDEPTSQLDPESSDAVFAIIRELKNRGKTIVLVEHKVDLMAEYVDRLIVMKAGRVAIEGEARDVLVSDQMVDAGVPRPEVTEFALALRESGRDLGTVPITRAEAYAAVQARLKEQRSADFTH